MKINNFAQLAVSDARRDLLAIAEAGLAAIDTRNVIRELVRVEGGAPGGGVGGGLLKLGGETVDLANVGTLVFIGVGKCAVDAAAAVEEILGDRIARGVAVDVKPIGAALSRITLFCGTHPLPSDENLAAAEAIVACLQDLTERDLVLFMVSGGGSTLLFLPEDRGDRGEVGVFQALTAAGATIQEMNVVRKHLSLARGGHLAQAAYPARVVSLIFSDVPGDDIASISSGPTVKDTTTVGDAEKVLAKYDVLRVGNIEKCGLVETPKDEKYFANTANVLAVSNRRALEAMRTAAGELGYVAEIKNTELTGEAADVARMVAETLRAVPPHTALFWGGETTVTLGKSGNGGRNITVCATALAYIQDGEEILSLASDGRDHGPYAGAICDTITKKAAADAGVDVEKYLAESDTYPLFEKIGNYLVTGDTGSNVSDLIIALKKE